MSGGEAHGALTALCGRTPPRSQGGNRVFADKDTQVERTGDGGKEVFTGYTFTGYTFTGYTFTGYTFTGYTFTEVMIYSHVSFFEVVAVFKPDGLAQCYLARLVRLGTIHSIGTAFFCYTGKPKAFPDQGVNCPFSIFGSQILNPAPSEMPSPKGFLSSYMSMVQLSNVLYTDLERVNPHYF